jgi:hypothetical protein
MFRIADGREHFYQWDLDRQIIVEDESIVEVHFCNRTDDCSLVVEVIDGLAAVPNLILQKNFDVRVFGYDGKATRHDEVFKVKARSKPADYVYTETETRSYEYLEERIDEIEKNGVSQEVIDEAVGKYLEENPLGDIPTKVSQLENDSNFITREEVPETDLSEYAKKSEIPDVSDFITSIPSEYITESELNARKYLTEVPSEYAKKSDIPRDYLTSIPSEYVTELELQAKGYSTFSGKYSDLTGKPDIPSTDGLAPVTYVDQKFNSIDLTPYAQKTEVAQTYAKKADIPTVPTKVSELTNDKGYINSIPSEYITETELNAKDYLTRQAHNEWETDFVRTLESLYVDNDELAAKGYLTEHQSLEGYATEKYVDDAIANIKIPEGGGGGDLTGYATEDYVDDAVKELADAVEPFIKSGGKVDQNSAAIAAIEEDLYDWPAQEHEYRFPTHEELAEAIANIEIPEGTTSSEIYLLTPLNTNEIVTDEKTIEYLDRCWAGEFPPLGYIANSGMGSTAKDRYQTAIVSVERWPEDSKMYLHAAGITGAIGPNNDDCTSFAHEYHKVDNTWVFKASHIRTKNYIEYSDYSIDMNAKQDKLYSGSNIKTINGESIMGSGNIEITGGGSSADLTNYYTKDETYSKTEIDDAIAGIELPEGSNSKEVYYLDFSGVPGGAENAIAATPEMAEFAERYKAGENVCAYICYEQLGTGGIQGYTPAVVNRSINRISLTQPYINLANIDSSTYPTSYITFYLRFTNNEWVQYADIKTTVTLATKDYVDGLFAGIATAEGGAY